MTSFQRIRISDWRQFRQVDIDLSRQVTILTGQNGTGKTTILSVLSRHFGWNLNFVSTPFWGTKKQRRFWSDVLRLRSSEVVDEPPEASLGVGEITYSNGQHCQLSTKQVVSAQYHLTYAGQQDVVGLHIPSHRPPATYHTVADIPTNPKSIQQHYQDFQQLLSQTYASAPKQQNPGIAQKKSIIALALFGYGNQAVAANPEYRAIFESFQDVLRKVLPVEIGFRALEVRMPEVVVVTNTGDFALDAMSGGINALFGIAWQIHMYGAGKLEYTVTIDEPENHLHPSMQRAFLPSLARAFPACRFIVATHSPFIVSSHRDSSVYGLTFREGQVISNHLGESELAATPNKVLKEILEVPSNFPIWVEDRIRDIVANADPANPKALGTALMEELNRLGVTDSPAELGGGDEG